MLDEALTDIWRAPLAIFKDRRFSFAMRRANRGFTRLREALRQRVAERRARGGADLFSRLCAESRAAGWLDDDGLVRLFIGVMVGAFDTTAAATTSMAYLLAKHPEWQERLRGRRSASARRACRTPTRSASRRPTRGVEGACGSFRSPETSRCRSATSGSASGRFLRASP